MSLISDPPLFTAWSALFDLNLNNVRRRKKNRLGSGVSLLWLFFIRYLFFSFREVGRMFLLATILLFGKIICTSHNITRTHFHIHMFFPPFIKKAFLIWVCFWPESVVFLMCLVDIWSSLCVVPHAGFASAQKVIQLNYCSIDEHNLRMDCKYALPPEAPEPFCKYTNGERLFDTTDPDEEQHAPFKKRAKARMFPGNICRLLFKNLPNGKSNFTCNIKYADSAIATKTSVVDKSKLPVLVTIILSFEWLPNQNAPPSEPALFLLLQSSSSPVRRGVSCYKAAVAYCWPWWHFPCCWKFTGCEQGAKLLDTLTLHP